MFPGPDVSATCEMWSPSNLKSITPAGCYMSVIWSVVIYLTFIYCTLKNIWTAQELDRLHSLKPQSLNLHPSHLHKLAMLSKNKLYDPEKHLCSTTTMVLHALVVFEGGGGLTDDIISVYPVHHSLVHSRVPEMLHCNFRSGQVAMTASRTSPFHQTLHTHSLAGKCIFKSPIPLLPTCLIPPASLSLSCKVMILMHIPTVFVIMQ